MPWHTQSGEHCKEVLPVQGSRLIHVEVVEGGVELLLRGAWAAKRGRPFGGGLRGPDTTVCPPRGPDLPVLRAYLLQGHDPVQT